MELLPEIAVSFESFPHQILSDRSIMESFYPKTLWGLPESWHSSLPFEGTDETCVLPHVVSTAPQTTDSVSSVGLCALVAESRLTDMLFSQQQLPYGRTSLIKRRSWQEALSSPLLSTTNMLHPAHSPTPETESGVSSVQYILNLQHIQAAADPKFASNSIFTATTEKPVDQAMAARLENFEYIANEDFEKLEHCSKPLDEHMGLHTKFYTREHAEISRIAAGRSMPSSADEQLIPAESCAHHPIRVFSTKDHSYGVHKWPDTATTCPGQESSVITNLSGPSLETQNPDPGALNHLSRECLSKKQMPAHRRYLEDWVKSNEETTFEDHAIVGDSVHFRAHGSKNTMAVFGNDWPSDTVSCKSTFVGKAEEHVAESKKRSLETKLPESTSTNVKRAHLGHHVSESMQHLKKVSGTGFPSPVYSSTKSVTGSSKSGKSSRHAQGPALNTNGKPRARQGSASDPQSIAARNRRERINARLKVLQELVPNGSKVDLVTMLEKAINYVKFLQLQLRVLSNDDYWPANGEIKVPQASKSDEYDTQVAASESVDEDMCMMTKSGGYS